MSELYHSPAGPSPEVANAYAWNRLVSVAPMLDWTDRHCRYFHRLLSQQVVLYTEMVTTGAIIHGKGAPTGAYVIARNSKGRVVARIDVESPAAAGILAEAETLVGRSVQVEHRDGTNFVTRVTSQ